MCFDRRKKQVLTSSDLDNARSILKVADSQLRLASLLLKEEVKHQLDYASYMATLYKCLEKKSYPTIGDKSVPGIQTLFSKAAKLCKKNPKF